MFDWVKKLWESLGQMEEEDYDPDTEIGAWDW